MNSNLLLNNPILAALPKTTERRIALSVTRAAERHLRSGHPWLFADSITKASHEGAPGDLAVVFDQKRRFVAVGLYDPTSPIRLRVLQQGTPATIDRAWFAQKLTSAAQLRQPLTANQQTTGYRLVYGENDGLPGLVIDRYAGTLVVKLYTTAWLPHLVDLLTALLALQNAEQIVLRLSRNVQQLSLQLYGLTEGMVIGETELTGPVVFLENGLRFEADPIHGQKTGFFLDQRENRARVERLAAGKRVLNLFAYNGGFSLYAARGGATQVTSLDSSRPALAAATRNFALNQSNPNVAKADHQLLAGDAFVLLQQLANDGMGKTSLAQEAAQRILHTNPAAFPDGIYFVALAGLTTTPSTTQESGIAEALLIAAIAEQIGCELQGGLSAQAQLQNYLQHCRLLLVLDNFEQLLEATDLLIALLTHAPAVTMLVTSRARLKVRGESVLPLSKLSLPSAAYVTGTAAVQASIIPAVGDDMWQESEAIAMFVQRAQCFDPHFAITPANLSSVMQICYLVDGLPLGIELATSMLPLLSCADLAKELAQSLAFLAVETRDLPHDQRTLGAVFARSWQLLPPDGQQLLAKLALFPHTFSYAAAVQIAGASNALLQRLIDHSLLCKVGDERYAMHHTVRTFAEEKLQQWPTQLAMLQVQFAHFYLDFLAQRERGLTGAAHALVTEQILTDWDNIRMAWRWAVAHELAAALRTCVNTLFLFYDQQGFYLEALDLYEYALHAFFPIYEAQPCKAGTDVTWLIGRLQTCCAVCHSRLGHVQAALRAFESSWAILQEADSPVASAFCLTHWGVWLTGRDPQRSTEFLTQALGLIQASGVAWLQALIGQSLGEIILLLGDYVAAEANVTQGLRLAQQLNWPRALISGHKALGRIHLARGHYDQAEKALHTAIGLAEHYHFKLLGLESMVALGEALRLQGQLAAAKACFSEVRQLIEPLGLVIPTAFILWEEGCLAEQCGDYRAAKALFSESLTAGLPPWWSHVLPTLGWALIGLGELVEAQRYFQKVLADAEAQARLPIVLDAQVGVAYIAMLQANTGQARAGELNPAERVNTVLQRVYQHGAATQETRTRVAKIAARLDFPRLKVTLPPPTPVAWTIVY